MPEAAEDFLSAHEGSEEDYLIGYPSYSFIESVLEKSVTPEEARLVFLNNNLADLNPYTDLIDRTSLY